MTSPEEMPRERASDVPEGMEVRADGSYVTPVDSLSEEQRTELLPSEEEVEEGQRKDQERLDLEEASRNDREVASMTDVPREQGTVVSELPGGAE